MSTEKHDEMPAATAGCAAATGYVGWLVQDCKLSPGQIRVVYQDDEGSWWGTFHEESGLGANIMGSVHWHGHHYTGTPITLPPHTTRIRRPMGRVTSSNSQHTQTMIEAIQTPSDGSQAPSGRVHPLVGPCCHFCGEDAGHTPRNCPACQDVEPTEKALLRCRKLLRECLIHFDDQFLAATCSDLHERICAELHWPND